MDLMHPVRAAETYALPPEEPLDEHGHEDTLDHDAGHCFYACYP
jgi:hypothetical protein